MTPDKYTIAEKFVNVSDGYSLYTHEWGNKAAESIFIYLHGGPGSHSKDRNKYFFNPIKHRVIFFDQRGSGKSTPLGSLENNNTDKMIMDISAIASQYQVDNFVLVGGSWGSCLALTYAINHPNKVKAMILTGIFTGSKAEIDWIDRGHFKTFFPDVWDNYLDATPKSHHTDPSKYHAKNAFGADDALAKKSAYAYSNMEGAIASLNDNYTFDDFETFDPSGTLIEMHYLKNNCFLPDNYILDNAKKLTMPIWLVQGRYDNVCPPITAYELNKKLPNGKLIWTIAGHGQEHESLSLMRTLINQFN